MNRVVVHPRRRRAGGVPPRPGRPARRPPSSIGYDARHSSDVFARDTAEVMTGAGLKACVLPRPLPTPLLAFAIRELGCVAGVMVTASHNPPAGQRLQGLPRRRQPDRAARPTPRSPRRDRRGRRAGRRAARRRRHGRSASTSSTATSTPSPTSPPTARATSTSSTRRCTASAARRCVAGARDRRLRAPRASSPQQEQPDPDFPTVAFPNPEEPGAMDLAMALADEARRRPGRRQRPRRRPVRRRRPRPARLADAARRRGRRAARRPPAARAASRAPTPRSIVSSSLLGQMAAAAGQPYAETLTGFKWIGRVAGLAFGYEEALGYCVDPEHVKDKDGVSALLLLCELAAEREGRRAARLRRPARRPRRRARPARHRPALGAGRRPRRDRRRDGPAARHARRPRSAASPSSGVDDLALGVGRPAADRRAALPARRAAPG